jgi:GR25 family glycosyltransferase involved in LPS biosynthesis
LSHYNHDIPLEIIYGKDTKTVENAIKYKKYVKPEYFKEALDMHYDAVRKRPDITYFNMGAIGCYMGHMEFYKRCFEQNIKYALMFEDNVVILNDEFYKKVQGVIDTMGDDFEICFFHCLSRYSGGRDKGLERVKWITSMKCYLVHVDNMKEYYKHFFPIDNHVDLKHEDIIAAGARVYYKDLRKYIKIDRSGPSTIGHRDWSNKHFFSRQYPSETPDALKHGF